jgi:hypothetical protein
MSMEGGRGRGREGGGRTEINRPPLERLYEAALERSCISIERGPLFRLVILFSWLSNGRESLEEKANGK